MNPSRQQALVDAAVSGDNVALKLLLAGCHARLCGLLVDRIPAELGRSVDVEDVLQEAHVHVFRSISAFRPDDDDAFFRWTATIALNHLRSAIRRHRAQKRGGGAPVVSGDPHSLEDSTVALFDMLVSPGKTPSRCVARNEAIQAVQGALALLPEKYQAVVQMVHIEGRPVKEAAESIGKTERAVHGLCRRALKALRAQLEQSSAYLSSSG